MKCPANCKALCCKSDTGIFQIEIFSSEYSFFYDKGVIVLVPFAYPAEYLEFLELTDKYLAKYLKSISVDLREFSFGNFLFAWGILVIFPDEKCPYLKGNKCSIYPSRPLMCRFYPKSFINKREILCSKCANLHLDLLAREKEVFALFNKYKNKFAKHKKDTKKLTQVLIDSYGETFVTSVVESLIKGKGEQFPINLPATILFNFAQKENEENLKSIRKQVELIDKLILLDKKDANSFKTLKSKYETLLKELSPYFTMQ